MFLAHFVDAEIKRASSGIKIINISFTAFRSVKHREGHFHTIFLHNHEELVLRYHATLSTHAPNLIN